MRGEKCAVPWHRRCGSVDRAGDLVQPGAGRTDRHRSGDRVVRPKGCELLVFEGEIALVIGTIGKAISTPENPVHLNAGFSTTGWLSVILMFGLARIFADGTRMRDDLEGTV